MSIDFRRTGAVAVAVALALVPAVTQAHHVSVPLSYIQGHDILQSVVYVTSGPLIGVPPYFASDRAFGHHETLSFTDGDSFGVAGTGDSTETVVLRAADFADIANVPLEEALAVINAKSALVRAFEANAFVMFRGQRGGPGATVELTDGNGAPLARLAHASRSLAGARDVVLDLSIPEEEHAAGGNHGESLAGHPFIVLVSRVDGTFDLLGSEIPIGFDPLVWQTLGQSGAPSLARLDVARLGGLASFTGRLNENEDALFSLREPDMLRLFGGTWPDRVHLAFIVLSEDRDEIEFVSNRFTIEFLR
jgi:hypothetical protein